MKDDFQQTVNLREKAESTRGVSPISHSAQAQISKKARPQPEPEPRLIRRKAKRRADEIDQVYNDEADDKTGRQDLRRITQPEVRRGNESIYKKIIIILAFILTGVIVYGLFFRGESGPVADSQEALKWYAVKLVTGEIYYGQVNDITADPVVISNVYYNYDQLNPSTNTGEEKSEVSNLRLVKRGKETHGPDGTMNIVRAQVVYMESLKEDSKVLKAILDYER
jgi:hypothetical protein